MSTTRSTPWAFAARATFSTPCSEEGGYGARSGETMRCDAMRCGARSGFRSALVAVERQERALARRAAARADAGARALWSTDAAERYPFPEAVKKAPLAPWAGWMGARTTQARTPGVVGGSASGCFPASLRHRRRRALGRLHALEHRTSIARADRRNERGTRAGAPSALRCTSRSR